jgi:transposase
MKGLESFPKILFYNGRVDFRKRRKSLACLVESQLKEDPFSETLFFFLNKRKDCVRALYWDKTGFAMWEKELEKEKFLLPKKCAGEKLYLSANQVEWLLDGVDIWKIKKHKKLDFSSLIY